MNFAQTVRNKRKAMGLSQKQLASKAGYSVRLISDIENDKVSPSLKVAVKIAIALNLAITIEGYEGNDRQPN